MAPCFTLWRSCGATVSASRGAPLAAQWRSVTPCDAHRPRDNLTLRVGCQRATKGPPKDCSKKTTVEKQEPTQTARDPVVSYFAFLFSLEVSLAISVVELTSDLGTWVNLAKYGVQTTFRTPQWAKHPAPHRSTLAEYAPSSNAGAQAERSGLSWRRWTSLHGRCFICLPLHARSVKRR